MYDMEDTTNDDLRELQRRLRRNAQSPKSGSGGSNTYSQEGERSPAANNIPPPPVPLAAPMTSMECNMQPTPPAANDIPPPPVPLAATMTSMEWNMQTISPAANDIPPAPVPLAATMTSMECNVQPTPPAANDIPPPPPYQPVGMAPMKMLPGSASVHPQMGMVPGYGPTGHMGPMKNPASMDPMPPQQLTGDPGMPGYNSVQPLAVYKIIVPTAVADMKNEGGEHSGERKEKAEDCLISCAGTSIIILVVLAVVGLGIAKVAIGFANLHNCSIERLIPIYLIVSGLAPIYFIKLVCHDDDNDGTCWQMCWMCVGILFCFSWLISGTVWVYPNYGIVMSEDFKLCTRIVTVDCSEGGCGTNFLKFAFAVVTIDWIVFAMLIGLLACSSCSSSKDIKIED